MFKFYLDNTLVSDPINWSDFTETIERDDNIKGILPKYETKLNFNAGGYKYLFDMLKSDGYCKLVQLKVDYKCSDDYETILNGYIFISDCKFNLNKCIVECDVQDDNFGARIFNNKKIKAYLNSDKSKNGETITVATKNQINMFVPVTGASVVGTRDVYKIKDAFRYLVDFMSDGLIGFESDFLDTDVIIKEVAIAIGKELRSPQNAAPYISFEELFVEVNKKFPIGFTIIRDSSNNPVVKIEDESYFYNTGTSLTIPNIENLQQSFDNEKLYSKVKFGGTIASYDASIHSFGQIQFLSFKNEEYHLEGECNIDKELDLVSNFIVDSNIIEELVATNITNESYDDDTFFIALASNVTAFPYPNPTTNTLPFYYNGSLTNNKVAERYSLANNLALYLGSGIAGFRASKTSEQYLGYAGRSWDLNAPLSQPVSNNFTVSFENDSTPPNFDAGSNYSTSTYRYTSSQSGNYQFLARINGRVQGCVDMSLSQSVVSCNSLITFYTFFEKYNASNNLIETKTFTHYTGAGDGSTNFSTGNLTHLFYLPAGYYCVISVAWQHSVHYDSRMYNSCAQVYLTTFNVLPTQFLTTATTTGGGIYEYEEANDYFVSKLEYERPISYADYKTLKLDLSKSWTVNHDGVTNKTAWIRKLQRNFSTGETKCELISNINNIQ